MRYHFCQCQDYTFKKCVRSGGSSYYMVKLMNHLLQEVITVSEGCAKNILSENSDWINLG